MVGEMSGLENVLVRKYLVGDVFFGELSVRGSVNQGSLHQGSVLGEVSVRELSTCQKACVQILTFLTSNFQ